MMEVWVNRVQTPNDINGHLTNLRRGKVLANNNPEDFFGLSVRGKTNVAYEC
jgi:hypothetical protein